MLLFSPTTCSSCQLSFSITGLHPQPYRQKTRNAFYFLERTWACHTLQLIVSEALFTSGNIDFLNITESLLTFCERLSIIIRPPFSYTKYIHHFIISAIPKFMWSPWKCLLSVVRVLWDHQQLQGQASMQCNAMGQLNPFLKLLISYSLFTGAFVVTIKMMIFSLCLVFFVYLIWSEFERLELIKILKKVAYLNKGMTNLFFVFLGLALN